MEMNTKKFEAIVELQKQLWMSAVSRLESTCATWMIGSSFEPWVEFQFEHSRQKIAYANANRVCYRAGLVFVSKPEEWTGIIKHELVHTILERIQKTNKDSQINRKNGFYKAHGEAFYLMHKLLWETNGDKYSNEISKHFPKAKEAIKLFHGLGIKDIKRWGESCTGAFTMCDGFIGVLE